MAILQEKRSDAPRPEVRETDYGVQYVNAGTETPIDIPAESEEDVVRSEEVAPVSAESVEPAVSFEEKPVVVKKKGGRSKKSRR